jgi:hypothetical protein
MTRRRARFLNRPTAPSAGGLKQNPPSPASLHRRYGRQRISSSAPIRSECGNALTAAVYGYFSTTARTDRGVGAQCKRAAIAPRRIATTCVKRDNDERRQANRCVRWRAVSIIIRKSPPDIIWNSPSTGVVTEQIPVILVSPVKWFGYS